MLADRVALLHEGQIAAVGTHADLLRTSPIYRHLISSLSDEPFTTDDEGGVA